MRRQFGLGGVLLLATASMLGACALLPGRAPGPGGFSYTGSMSGTPDHPTATLLQDGRALVAGGQDADSNDLAPAEVYDPRTGTFDPTGSMSAPRLFDTATLLQDGEVLIAGGIDSSGTPLASAELYDPKTGTFRETGSMITPRMSHTATLLRDGKVLIAGGIADAGGEVVNDSADLYDPNTGIFSATGSMIVPRVFHTATLLRDGRVLVVGGQSDWAEIYDPATATFTTTGPMAAERSMQTATLLADGRVLVVGGEGDTTGSVSTGEIYDPATARFSSKGSMHEARKDHVAAILPNGSVLVAGGDDYDASGENDLSSAELYDPRTGAFSITGSLETVRVWAAAAVLEDGHVLVVGGFGESSAELYWP